MPKRGVGRDTLADIAVQFKPVEIKRDYSIAKGHTALPQMCELQSECEAVRLFGPASLAGKKVRVLVLAAAHAHGQQPEGARKEGLLCVMQGRVWRVEEGKLHVSHGGMLLAVPTEVADVPPQTDVVTRLYLQTPETPERRGGRDAPQAPSLASGS